MSTAALTIISSLLGLLAVGAASVAALLYLGATQRARARRKHAKNAAKNRARPEKDRMLNLAHYIHDACHQAAMNCPQFRGYDDDQQVLVNGRWVDFGDLPNKGLETVVRFWRSPEQSGGDLLFRKGYAEGLPEDVAQIFERVDALLSQAISQAAREFSCDAAKS